MIIKTLKRTIRDLYETLSKWSFYKFSSKSAILLEILGLITLNVLKVSKTNTLYRCLRAFSIRFRIPLNIIIAEMCTSKFKIMLSLNRKWENSLRRALMALSNVNDVGLIRKHSTIFSRHYFCMQPQSQMFVMVLNPSLAFALSLRNSSTETAWIKVHPQMRFILPFPVASSFLIV